MQSVHCSTVSFSNALLLHIPGFSAPALPGKTVAEDGGEIVSAVLLSWVSAIAASVWQVLAVGCRPYYERFSVRFIECLFGFSGCFEPCVAKFAMFRDFSGTGFNRF